jgi:multiple sugar transport system substrate-binding protein
MSQALFLMGLLSGIMLFVCSLVAVSAPVTIRHIDWASPEMEAWLQESADQFYKETGIKVEIELVPSSQVAARLTVLLAGGVPPQTSWFLPERLPQFRDVMIDLTPYIRRDNVKIESFAPGFVGNLYTAGADPGTINALPVSLFTYAIAYNENILGDAGLNAPPTEWTWADMIDYVRKTALDTNSDGVIERPGLQMPIRWDRLGVLLHHAGGKWLNDVRNPTASLLLSAEVAQTLDFVAELWQAGGANLQGIGDFYQGTAAFLFGASPNVPVELQKTLSDNVFNFRWQPFAKGPGENTGGELEYQFYGIFKDAAHHEEAWQWLKFLTARTETQLRLAQTAHRIPAYQPAAIRYIKEIQASHPSVSVYMMQWEDPTSYTRPPWQPLTTLLNPWLVRAISTRDISIREAMEQAHQLIEADLPNW